MTLAIDGFPQLVLITVGLDVTKISSFEPFLGLEEDVFAHIVDIDLASVVHEWGEGKGLPSGSTSVVQDSLAWLAVHSHGSELGAFILDFEEALTELWEGVEAAFGFLNEGDSHWGMVSFLSLEALLLELPEEIMPGDLHCVGSHSEGRPLVESLTHVKAFLLTIGFCDEIIQIFREGGPDVGWNLAIFEILFKF